MDKKTNPQLRQLESLFAAPVETTIITSTPTSITTASRRSSHSPEVTIIEKSVERDFGCDIHGGRRDSLGALSAKRESIGSLFGGHNYQPTTIKHVVAMPDKPTATTTTTSLSSLLQSHGTTAAAKEVATIENNNNNNNNHISISSSKGDNDLNGNVPPQRTLGLARKTPFPISSTSSVASTAPVLPVVRSSSAYSLNRAAQLRMRESADREAAASAAALRFGAAKSASGVQRRQSFAGGNRSADVSR